MILNFFLWALPPTRMFLFKRWLANLLGLSVGRGSAICGKTSFYGGGTVVIGEDTWIGIGTSFYTTPSASIKIGDRCDIAPEVSFVCGSHERGSRTRRAGAGVSAGIEVGAGCWIGARATLLGGALIDVGTVVGAMTLVRAGSYGSDQLLVGVPAQQIRQLP